MYDINVTERSTTKQSSYSKGPKVTERLWFITVIFINLLTVYFCPCLSVYLCDCRSVMPVYVHDSKLSITEMPVTPTLQTKYNYGSDVAILSQ